jgi:thiol-disulfide isomerase/thioredoxin
MRSLKPLITENSLNDVLKRRKVASFSVLYVSPWCKYCDSILQLAEEWKVREGEEKVYIVDSWNLPGSFATFSITSAPSLVHFSRGRTSVDVEYPKVRDYFKAPRPRNA